MRREAPTLFLQARRVLQEPPVTEKIRVAGVTDFEARPAAHRPYSPEPFPEYSLSIPVKQASSKLRNREMSAVESELRSRCSILAMPRWTDNSSAHGPPSLIPPASPCLGPALPIAQSANDVPGQPVIFQPCPAELPNEGGQVPRRRKRDIGSLDVFSSRRLRLPWRPNSTPTLGWEMPNGCARSGSSSTPSMIL